MKNKKSQIIGVPIMPETAGHVGKEVAGRGAKAPLFILEIGGKQNGI
jgi:hypothetical protein